MIRSTLKDVVSGGSLRLNLTQHGETHQVELGLEKSMIDSSIIELVHSETDFRTVKHFHSGASATPAGSGNAFGPILRRVFQETAATRAKRWATWLKVRANPREIGLLW
jgi:hypothetical protein